MMVLLDTCVILDALQDRHPFAEDAKRIFLAAANQKIKACITAKSVADIYYLLHKATHSDKESRKILASLFTLFGVLDAAGEECQAALFSPITDYEDALMVETAKNAGADYIVTRNMKDYTHSSVDVLTPADYVKLI